MIYSLIDLKYHCKANNLGFLIKYELMKQWTKKYCYLLHKERGPKDLVELTTWAQKYLIAHKEQLGKSKATVQPRRADQKKTTQSKQDSSQGRQRLLRWYRCQGFGHR